MREPRVLNGLHLVVARSALRYVSDLVRELSDMVGNSKHGGKRLGAVRPDGAANKSTSERGATSPELAKP